MDVYNIDTVALDCVRSLRKKVSSACSLQAVGLNSLQLPFLSPFRERSQEALLMSYVLTGEVS